MKKNIKKSFLAMLSLSFLLATQTAMAADLSSNDYVNSVYDFIKENYRGSVTDKKLTEGALKGIFGTMDDYTTFYTLDEAETFFSDVEGKYSGIGIMIGKVSDYITVDKVFDESPAKKAGLLNNDKIAEVDGKSIIGVSTEEASVLIKGKSGSLVKLGILRDKSAEIKYFEIERAEVKVNPVQYEIRGDVGYIKLDMFNSNENEYLYKVLDEVDKKGIRKIILDLRNNPGGMVDQAVNTAKKFVPKGLITKLDFKSELKTDKEYYSDLSELKYKLVVLVNESSASASEIFAGAIQDTKAGTLVGIKTFGKAKVQETMPILTPEAQIKYEKETGEKIINAYDLYTKYGKLALDSELIGYAKITVGQYTTPNGRMIDLIGLTPDVVIENNTVDKISIEDVTELTKTNKPTLGSSSSDVLNAEWILKLAGYEVADPDLELDNKTFTAIQKFQKDKGLYSYGVLDFATQKALNELKLSMDAQYNKAIEILNK